MRFRCLVADMKLTVICPGTTGLAAPPPVSEEWPLVVVAGEVIADTEEECGEEW
jgi:hypothetical protein